MVHQNASTCTNPPKVNNTSRKKKTHPLSSAFFRIKHRHPRNPRPKHTHLHNLQNNQTLQQLILSTPPLRHIIETLVQFLVTPSGHDTTWQDRVLKIQNDPHHKENPSLAEPRLTFIRHLVEDFLSDDHLVRTQKLYTQLTQLFETKEKKPKDKMVFVESTQMEWINHLSETLSRPQEGLGCCRNVNVDETCQAFFTSLIEDSRLWETKGVTVPYPCASHPSVRNPFVYSEKILWIEAESLVGLAEMHTLNVTPKELVRACLFSDRLCCGVRKSSAAHYVAQRMVDFFQTYSLRDFGLPLERLANRLNKLRVRGRNKTTTQNELLLSDTALLKHLFLHFYTNTELPSPLRHQFSDFSGLCVGRPLAGIHHLRTLRQDLQGRTCFVDNLPFHCTVEILNDFLHRHGIVATHIVLPRFVVSRETKGFAFIEMSSHSTMQDVIHLFHRQPPSVLPGKRLRSRNRHPMFSCTHTQWESAKTQQKRSDILGFQRETPDSSSTLTPSWVAIENIQPSISPLTLMHFVQHSVVPLRLYFTPTHSKALVLLKSLQEAQRLCFEVNLSKRSIGASPYTITARLTKAPLDANAL